MNRLLVRKASRPYPAIAIVEHADTFSMRLRGLLGREPLLKHSGLMISPCYQVHSIGMNYALDIVFLDKAGLVLSFDQHLMPYRIAVNRRAYQVLELPAGRIGQCALQRGERLLWDEIKPNREINYEFY